MTNNFKVGDYIRISGGFNERWAGKIKVVTRVGDGYGDWAVFISYYIQGSKHPLVLGLSRDEIEMATDAEILLAKLLGEI